MLIPDLNRLIYAYDSTSPRRAAAARAWWENLLRSSRVVGMSWVVVLGFLRLMTKPRIQRNPMDLTVAIGHVRRWLAQVRVQIVSSGDRHAEILFQLLQQVGSAGNLTTDAHLAAIAIEYGAELATTDADLSRFPGLRRSNPIARTLCRTDLSGRFG